MMAIPFLLRQKKGSRFEMAFGFLDNELHILLWSDCKDRDFLEHTEGVGWFFSRTVKAGITAIAEHCAAIPSSVFPAGA